MRSILLMFFLSVSMGVFAQNSRVAVEKKNPSALDLYKVFYEFKNYEIENSNQATIFSSFNVYNFEQFRKQNEDVEIYLSSLDKTLVLYSVNKVHEIKLEKDIKF